MGQPYFKIRKAIDEFYFILVAANGETVATSETYESKQGAKHGIEAVKSACADAVIIDETI